MGSSLGHVTLFSSFIKPFCVTIFSKFFFLNCNDWLNISSHNSNSNFYRDVFTLSFCNYLCRRYLEGIRGTSKKTQVWWFGYKSLGLDDVINVRSEVHKYYYKTHDSLDEFYKSIEPYSQAIVIKVLRELLRSFDEFNLIPKLPFNFKPELKVNVALNTCVYAFTIFKHNTKKIKSDNDPVVKLQGSKEIFLCTFKSQYIRVKTEKAAAEKLCNLLVKSILAELQIDLESEIVQDLIATLHCRFES